MKDRIRKRALLFLAGLIILFSVLGARLYYIQTANAEWLIKRAQSLWERNQTVSPERGTIFDRNGRQLAYDAPAFTVIAYPSEIKDVDATVRKLAPVIGMPESKMRALILNNRDKVQVELRNEGWKISTEVANQVRQLELLGIDLYEERKRYYPADELASHVLGYIDKEGTARLGLELYYNDQLSGTPGTYQFLKDRKGYQLPDGVKNYTPVADGNDLVLTIDTTIQHFVEKALDAAAQKYSPKNMIAIVADPKTGAVLAMSVRPNYNPNEYWSFSSFNDFRNSSISYSFEPGSTFKIVTLAGAIEEGIFDPLATYTSGQLKGDYGTIMDYNAGRGWGDITFLEGVQRSSNVAFVKLGYEGLGKDKLYSYIEKFGFGKRTGIDLPNESEGVFAKRPYARDVANASFGQGIMVTAIQQVAAVSAVANGGLLMKPYIVKEIRKRGSDEIIQTNRPIEVARVISEETAQKTRLILEKVVDDPKKGTGNRAYLEGYRVAGKTGTAQIVRDGEYVDGEYIASFIGFAPANDPRLVVYVMVQEPDIEGAYGGGSIAAPIFREVMANSLNYLRVEPQSLEMSVMSAPTAAASSIVALNVVDTSVKMAESRLSESGLSSVVFGKGEKVVAQFPEAGTEMAESQRMYLITEPIKRITVPSFTGYSMVEALEVCSILELSCEVVGNGYVVSQSVGAGDKVDGKPILITLRPPGEKPGTEEEADTTVDDGS